MQSQNTVSQHQHQCFGKKGEVIERKWSNRKGEALRLYAIVVWLYGNRCTRRGFSECNVPQVEMNVPPGPYNSINHQGTLLHNIPGRFRDKEREADSQICLQPINSKLAASWRLRLKSRLKCSWAVNFGWDAKVGERSHQKEKEKQSGRKKMWWQICFWAAVVHGAEAGVCLATMHGCRHTHTHTDQSRTTNHNTRTLGSWFLIHSEWVSWHERQSFKHLSSFRHRSHTVGLTHDFLADLCIRGFLEKLKTEDRTKGLDIFMC